MKNNFVLHDQMQCETHMALNHFKFISKSRLYQRKIIGCCHEFGVLETCRRTVRELSRLFKNYKNVLDISLITENLAVGAAPRSVSATKRLNELGFKHIIDLRAERKKTDVLVNTEDVYVHWIPIYDDWRPMPPEYFQNLEAEINTILRSKNIGKLLLCCGAGEHRAPIAGIMALVSMGHSLESSIVMIQKARPVAELLPIYKSSLKVFLRG
jgi:hypothetical protein